jgi:hypothetical protein
MTGSETLMTGKGDQESHAIRWEPYDLDMSTGEPDSSSESYVWQCCGVWAGVGVFLFGFWAGVLAIARTLIG